MENKKLSNYVSGKVAKTILGCSDSTLRNWANSGQINVVRNKDKGKRFYDISNIVSNEFSSAPNISKKEQICYCRVSSRNQKDDLERQVKSMQEQFPNAIIVKDIGSGINWKRKGLQSILQKTFNGKVEQIIIAHRDRLCRFAYELLEFIFELYKVKLVVLDSREVEHSYQEELCDDILSIMQIYSCRKMGKRRYKTERNEIKDKEIK